METVNYYIPSEFQVMLNPDTSSVSLRFLRFFLETEEDILQLAVYENDTKLTEPVPEEVCNQICELGHKQQLTPAVIEKLLQPLKQSLIKKKAQTQQTELLNLSYILSVARGYLTKNGQPVAVFTEGAMRPDMFSDIYSLCFTLPFKDSDKILIITSEEHILRDKEQIIFLFMADHAIYRATATVKNGQFYLQQIVRGTEMKHQDFFEKESPLPDIYRRFTARKSWLNLRKS